MEHPLPGFIHELTWGSVPASTQAMARQCLLDLLGVAASGSQTKLSHIISDHALTQFAKGPVGSGGRLLFDGRVCSAAGAALANGMMIDSVDAHDGYKPSKGHAGCGVVAATLALLHHSLPASDITEEELLTSIVIGYEIACRAGVALHESVPDYHTSGAWVAIAAAAVGARSMQLSIDKTRAALGIAEYHGPRSQMMRCIDHPTMLKDGSGWGAMAGVSAAFLANDGFTGAPAISLEADELAHHYSDLGARWLIEEQYFKPYPVCRWAQPAVVAALKLQREHGFKLGDIQQLRIGTFHESWRLSTSKPATTEQAQYSLPFPVAAALYRGTLTVEDIDGEGLNNQAVLALSDAIQLHEVDAYNAAFPAKRISDVVISLNDGRVLESGPTEADGDPESPLSLSEIKTKFSLYAEPVIGKQTSDKLMDSVLSMGQQQQSIESLNELIYGAVTTA